MSEKAIPIFSEKDEISNENSSFFPNFSRENSNSSVADESIVLPIDKDSTIEKLFPENGMNTVTMKDVAQPLFENASHSCDFSLPIAENQESFLPEKKENDLENFSFDRKDAQLSNIELGNDPLTVSVEEDMKILLQKYPGFSISDQIHWRSTLRFFRDPAGKDQEDKIAELGSKVLDKLPGILKEVSRITQQYTALCASEKIQNIVESAKSSVGALQKPSGLLGKLEIGINKALHHFDPEEAKNQLLGIQVAVQGIQSRCGPISDWVQEAKSQIQAEIPILQYLLEEQKGRSLEASLSRRHDLFLAASQQMILAEKQVQNIIQQIRGILRSIEEVRTITLPGLGFLQSF